MIDTGYVRTAPPIYDKQGVRWWLVIHEEGFTFARGGTTRTARLAREEIRHAREIASWEKRRESQQPTHLMLRDGSLRAFA